MQPTDDIDSTTDERKQFIKAHRKALDLLARRDHARGELRLKLIQKGFPSTLAEAVIQQLESKGLINASRFAENYTHYRRQKGYGPRRIALELETKGVPEAVIAEHVKITDNAWLIDIRTVWKKHFKSRLPADKMQRAKQMRFLLNRGFTQQQINTLFKHSEEVDE